MAVTAEFTGGCIDAPIATPDVLTAAPTTGVLPTTTVLRPTMGGTGTIEVAQPPQVVIEREFDRDQKVRRFTSPRAVGGYRG